jgi:putative copper resistance protein D
LSASDLTGMPVVELLGRTDLLPEVAGTDRILAQLATLWVALAVALFATRLTSGVSAGAVLIIAVAAPLPTALTGHAGHHESPTVAVIALGVHLAAAAIWVGGLLALVVHLRRFPDELRRAVPRFSAAALLCVIAVGLSGIVESVVTLQVWDALWTTDRGT